MIFNFLILDEKIIHMDPHSCQPAVDVEKEDFNEKV